MASTHLLFSTSLPTPLSLPSQSPSFFSNTLSLTSIKKRDNLSITMAGTGELLGDFGGRDPFPEEIESQFGAKVLGNFNTEHKILIPNISAMSLAQQDFVQVLPSQSPMSAVDAKELIRKVIGWRLVDDKGIQKLQCLWKVKDYKAGVDLISRIYEATQDFGHFPNLQLERPGHVRAELWTASIGGLSLNDFIVASKIDAIKTSDLVPRKRAWA
ncbi:4a-hydroxytetrahydrobiopterin dehydratase [Ranunculus cassubicifolius]